MLTKEIRDYLANNGVSNVYYDTMPDAVDNVVCVFGDVGGDVERYIEHPAIQILIRNKSDTDGYNVRATVFHLLHNVKLVLATINISSSLVVSTLKLPRDEKSRFIWSINCTVTKKV